MDRAMLRGGAPLGAAGVAGTLMCLLGLAACPGDSDDSEGRCIPGESRQCACPDGRSGRQVCADDGRSLGACECDGSGGDGGAPAKADGAAAPTPTPPPATPPPSLLKLPPPPPPGPGAVAITTAPQPDMGTMGLWHFDEGQAEAANDAGPNGVHAKAEGATWTEGRFGKALLFNGSSAKVAVPASPGLNPTGSVTIEAWVRPESSREMEIYHGHDGLGLGLRGRGSAVELVFRLHIGGAPRVLASTSPLALWQWHHVAGSYDGTKMEVWIDGRHDGEMAVAGPHSPASGCASPAIGARCDGGGGWFHGSIDEVRLSSVVRYQKSASDEEAVASREGSTPTKGGGPAPGKAPEKGAGGGPDAGPASKLPPGLREIAGPAAREVGKILGVE